MDHQEPLVPAEVDLRDFAYMPLDVVRLRDSDLAAVSTGEGFRAAVMLWCASWHQQPAASLPDDDRLLARLAGFGRDVGAWEEVSEEALRGFVKCSDGRLYHPVIADKANEAWRAKQARMARTERATATRRNPPRGAGRSDAAHNDRDDERHVERHVERDDVDNDQRNVHQGKGSKGKGYTPPVAPPCGVGDAGEDDRLVRARRRIVAAYGNDLPPDTGYIAVWLGQGFDPDICAAIVEASAQRGKKPKTLKYFDNAIREAHETRAPAPVPKGPPPKPADPQEIPAGRWHELLDMRRITGAWNAARYGPPPGDPGCIVPAEVLSLDLERNGQAA